MRKFIGLVLLIMHLSVFGQVKLYPQVGIAFANTRMIGKSQFLKTKQMESSQYFGLSLEKQFERHSLGVNFLISDIILHSKFYYQGQYGGEGRKVSGIGTTQNLIGFNYSYDWFGVNWFRINKKVTGSMPVVDEYNLANKKYLLNFRIQPIVGLSLVKVVDTNWDGCRFDPVDSSKVSLDGGTSLGIGGDDGWDYGPQGSNKIVNHEWGMALQFGFRTQFVKNGKDRLVLGFIYNQGLTTLLKTTFTTNILQNKGTTYITETAMYGGRGSFLSIYASYPITLVNKKGERRSDRKLLN